MIKSKTPTGTSLVRTKDSADFPRLPAALRRKIAEHAGSGGSAGDNAADRLFKIRRTPRHQWLKRLKPPAEHDVRVNTGKPPLPGAFEDRLVTETRWNAIYQPLLASPRALDFRIAMILLQCQPEKPCGLSLCPHCLRRWRINYVWQLRDFITKHYPKARLWAVTLAHSTGTIYPQDLLSKGSFKDAKDLLRKHFKRAGLGHLIVIGGMDISNNQDSEGKLLPHYEIHAHLIVIGGTKREIEDGLEKYYRPTTEIRRPVMVKPVYGYFGWATYTYKSKFSKRVSFIDKRTGHRNTPRRHWDLDGPQKMEVARFLAKQTLAERLVLIGVVRRGQKLVVEERD